MVVFVIKHLLGILLTCDLDLTHCITRTDVAPSTTTVTKTSHQPVSLRSFKLPTPKIAIAAKVTQLLSEQGINHTRLVMPTRENCAQLEVLIEAATALLETKKVVDRVEQDIRLLKARLLSKEGNVVGEDNAMDVDQETSGEGEALEGRSQSVVSTRSGGRGRKGVSATIQYLILI
jgi:DNA methyltransferase 1-associated protein 1